MWLESLRQFLDRSFLRAGGWARGLEARRARLVHGWITSIGETLPQQPEGEPAPYVTAAVSPVAATTTVHPTAVVPTVAVPAAAVPTVDFSYHFRSMDCQVQVRILEPTAGMRYIYRALQGTREE